jgi:capsule polysaccharide export protein KpsE/RkpR
MSKPTGLATLAIESKREEIAAAKAELAKLIRMRKDARIELAAKRAAAKELKAIDRAEKKSARIAKLEAKLLALKSKPVGTKAIKANKKPSACTTVYQMAA